jgi:hypothetical protein
MKGRWTFIPSVDEASREPPLSDARQLAPLRELLADIGNDPDILEMFLNDYWNAFVARPNDPDAEYVGNGITFRISGDEVIFTPLYDQWGDAGYVYVPLADVQDLIDQYAAYIRAR